MVGECLVDGDIVVGKLVDDVVLDVVGLCGGFVEDGVYFFY